MPTSIFPPTDVVSQEDVALIADEMELDKAIAERKLREHKGDVVQTLAALVAV